jgi:hypothetical protein
MLFTGNSDCNDINDLANSTHQRTAKTLYIVFALWASGIRASGHQAIRPSGHQAIRPSGHQAIRPSGHQGFWVMDIGFTLFPDFNNVRHFVAAAT